MATAVSNLVADRLSLNSECECLFIKIKNVKLLPSYFAGRVANIKERESAIF